MRNIMNLEVFWSWIFGILILGIAFQGAISAWLRPQNGSMAPTFEVMMKATYDETTKQYIRNTNEIWIFSKEQLYHH